jgi:hypothetical protein
VAKRPESLYPADELKTRFPVISGLVCLACVVAAVVEYHETSSKRRALEAYRLENDTLTARLSEARRSGLADLRKVAELGEEADKLGKQEASAGAQDPLEAGRRFLAAHPESRELVMAIMKDIAAGWPARRGREAGFSEAQVAQWMSLFARQKGAPFYIVDGIRVPGYGDLNSDDAQFSMLKATVGDELYAKYEEVNRTVDTRYMAGDISALAASWGAPLASDQNQALLQALTKAGGHFDWDVVSQKLGGVLSDSQMAAFEAEKASDLSSQAANSYQESFIKARGADK